MTYQHLSQNAYESSFPVVGDTLSYSLTPNLSRKKVLPCIRQIMSVVPSRRRIINPVYMGRNGEADLDFINHESSSSSLSESDGSVQKTAFTADCIRRGRNFKQIASPLISLRKKFKNFTSNATEPYRRPLFSSIFDQNYISEKFQNCYLAGDSSDEDVDESQDDLEMINLMSNTYLKAVQNSGDKDDLKSYQTEGIIHVVLRKEYPQEKYGLKLEKTTYNTTFITMVLPQSIAEKSGLNVGDRIVRINDLNTSDMSLLEITEQIRLANHSVSISYQPKTFLHTAVLHKEKGKLGIRLKEHSSNLWIDIVLPFSPAEKSGLKKGQRLISLNSNNVVGWTHKQAIEWLRMYPDNYDLILLVQDTNDDDSIRFQNSDSQTCPNVNIDSYAGKTPNSDDKNNNQVIPQKI